MNRFEFKPYFLSGPGRTDLLSRDLPEPLRLAILLGLDAGMRLIEIMELRWRDLCDRDIIFIDSIDAERPELWRNAPMTPCIRLTLPEPGDPDDTILPMHSAKFWCDELWDVSKGVAEFDALPREPRYNGWRMLYETFAVLKAAGDENHPGLREHELACLMGWQEWMRAVPYVAMGRALWTMEVYKRKSEVQ